MTVGSKYEATRELDTPEIAKLVRRDLRERFPDYAFRVRISRGLMCDAIYITVLRVPYSGPLRWDELATFGDVAKAYGYDRSDAQCDYYDVRFHVGPEFDRSLLAKFVSAERLA